jgi:DNA polymerase III subunit alpha
MKLKKNEIAFTDDKNNKYEKKQKKLYIKVRDKEHYKKVKKDLFSCLHKYLGNDCVIVYNESEKANMILPKKSWVNTNDEKLIDNLKLFFGENNIAIK